jgi:hypothetical protein
MKKPNFFIVGAPKCGTTAISEYLREHRAIFMSQPKEPHFFAEDFVALRIIKSLDGYESLFQNATSEHLAVGEASVSYLYSSVAIRNIHQFNRDAKIIAMLRNPVDLVYSLHSQLVYTCHEDEKDFQKAWKLQAERRNGNRVPKHFHKAVYLQYAQVGRLGVQVERLLTIFPLEQVKLILLDDFIANPQAVYEDIISFLEVPSDGRSIFPRINENKRPRMSWLNNLTQAPPEVVRYTANVFKKFPGMKSLNVRKKIQRLNAKREPRPPLPLAVRAELIDNFREDIDKLSRIVDRDLSDWYEA